MQETVLVQKSLLSAWTKNGQREILPRFVLQKKEETCQDLPKDMMEAKMVVKLWLSMWSCNELPNSKDHSYSFLFWIMDSIYSLYTL